MRKSQANSRRTTRSAQSRANGATLIPILIFAIGILGLLVFRQTWQTAPVSDSAPPKPQGTPISNPSTTETWTPAKGLPSQVMRLAFSEADTTRGYASVFVNKQTQALYTTTDHGLSWHQVGTVQSPVGDIVSTDPLDPQDVVMLTVYAPTPGTYAFQRSLDGGHTWMTQTTDLSTTGEVSQTGWSDSTFLVGFELDGRLQGSSAVVAFPRGQASVHLDVNGKINGKAIPHLRLLTGRHNRIQVWGTDDSTEQNSIGVATTDLGRNWVSLPSAILGKKLIPTASTADGSAVVAISADSKTIAISGDSGNTWMARPSFANTQPLKGIFVATQSKTIVVSRGDGTYVLRDGTWNRVTSEQVVGVSDTGAQPGARLWTYDAQGHVVWCDA